MDEGSDQPTKEADEPSSSGPRTVKVDWSASQAVLLASTDAEWKVSAPAAADSDYRAKSVPLPPKEDFFEGTHRDWPSAESPRRRLSAMRSTARRENDSLAPVRSAERPRDGLGDR